MAIKEQNDTEVTVAVLLEKYSNLAKEVDSLKKDRDSAVRWGIATLGAAVLGLAGYIFSLLEGAIKLR